MHLITEFLARVVWLLYFFSTFAPHVDGLDCSSGQNTACLGNVCHNVTVYDPRDDSSLIFANGTIDYNVTLRAVCTDNGAMHERQNKHWHTALNLNLCLAYQQSRILPCDG